MTDKHALVASLQPLISRLRTDTCWIVKPGSPPMRIDSPLTEERMLRHVDGGPRVGAVPIKPGESTTLVGLLDLDSHKGDVAWLGMQMVAYQVMDVGAEHGVRFVPFRSSGGHGMHLYALWAGPQDAYSVRCLLRKIIGEVSFKDGARGIAGHEIEVFPKQDSVGPGSFGNMFVLPLAGKSRPLDPLVLEDLPLDALVCVDWPLSEPVPVVEKPVPGGRDMGIPTSGDLKVLASALDAIPNSGPDELDYDQWFEVLCGIHAGSGGSDEGLDLAHKFSAKSSKYDPELIDNVKWPSIKLVHGGERGGITAGTVYKYARQYGWVEPVEDQFGVIEVPAAKPGAPEKRELPAFARDKYGNIESTITNVIAAVGCPEFCGATIRYDAFRDEIVIAYEGGGEWHQLKDVDAVNLRCALERRDFKPVGKEMMRDAILKIADLNQFDSAIEWLDGLQWDGVPRVERFLTTYMSAEDTEYHRAVSRYMWTALAGRAAVPGIQADMVPIFISEQGTGKSTTIAALAPTPDAFTEIDLHEKESDQGRRMRGVLIAELAELRGLNSRDEETIRAFVTRRKEEWTPKYMEHKKTFWRRLLIVGSSNRDDILADRTGNRRWLPVRVGVSDRDAVFRDRDQLWAEARVLFDIVGVDFVTAQEDAKEVHDEFMIADSWADALEDWLYTPDELSGEVPADREFLKLEEVAHTCFGLSIDKLRMGEQRRIGDLLRAKNYEKKDVKRDRKVFKAWFPKGSA